MPEPTPEQAAAGRQIAYRIRAELVCCNVYDEVQAGRRKHPEVSGSSHTICYWGEASARIAETPEQWRDDPDDHDWSGLDVVQRRARREQP